MANIKGTQVKDLPISEAIIESDVFVKQNTTSRQTQSFTAQTLSNYARQELDIDTIEDNIEDLQTRTTNIEKKGLFGVWSADATYGLYAIVRKNNTYWISLQDNNTNHDPEELNSEWWELFKIGGGGEREVGTMFFSIVPPAGLDENPARVFELNTKPEDDPIDLTLYPDLRVFAVDLEVRYPSLFVDRQTWISTYNSTKFGQCPFFCWGNANKQSIYLPSIKDVTGKGTPFTVQKQEVPTGTMTAMTLINYLQLDGAFTASPASSGYTGGNGFGEIRGRNFTYDPQIAGDNTFNANGSDNKIEAIVGRWYIQAVAPKTPMPTLFDFKGSVSSVQDLPQASSNKSNIYLVDNATDGGLYLSDGSTWNLIMEPASIVNLTSLVNRVTTLEQNIKIIMQKLPTNEDTTWYKLYSNGWCEQGGTLGTLPATTTTYRDTVIFNVPFVDRNYTLLPGEHNTGTGEYPVYNGKTATSFDIEYKGYCCWFACGLVDVSLI